MNIEKIRMWLVYKLLGNTPLISGVTFYQTICVDIDSGININNVEVKCQHKLDWMGKREGIGIYFDYYENSINEANSINNGDSNNE